MWFLTPQVNLGAFSPLQKRNIFQPMQSCDGTWPSIPIFKAMWNTEAQCSVELNRPSSKGPVQALFPLACAKIMSQ